jgi:hypothetical protein
VGVTPAPGGGVRSTFNNNSAVNDPVRWYDWANWQNYWWPRYPTTGSYRVDYIVATVTPSPSSCAKRPQGDSNCDGKIDILDYTCWRHHFLNGSPLANCKTSDYDGKESVNILDFTIWKNTFLMEQGRQRDE